MKTLTPNIMVQSKSMVDFKTGVNELLEKRSYFKSQVLPSLKEGLDYHVIKGRKSLSKGGAEKLCSIYNLSAFFEKDKDTMSAFSHIAGLIAYVCTLSRNGVVQGQGRGCSTLAKCENDPNKAIKMAEKSSYISATIRTTGLSDIFTQDLENMPEQALSIPVIEEGMTIKETIDGPKLATEKQRQFLQQLIAEKCDDSSKENYIEQLKEPTLSRFDCSELISSLLPMR